ncbi:hypothetical protein [Sinomicrobium kalidii]|nr:hypothetical protein [Sinomicrobium kalidii]
MTIDVLELLKKDWIKKEASYPRFSYEDIIKIIRKRPSFDIPM